MNLEGEIHKSVTIHSNDPLQPVKTIELKAFIKQLISISRKSISFQGTAGKIITQSIEIKANQDKPLELKIASFDLEQKIDYRIEEVSQGKLFKIHFTNKPGPVENYSGSLLLGTNYPQKQEIKILIWANFTAN